MVYVDWYYEKYKGEEKTFEEKQSDYMDWEDLVTETRYCISKKDYERIKKEAKEKLEQHFSEDDLESIEKFFYQPQGIDETSLFPDLPYFIEGKEKCGRIRDYVCFRTACLYILRYEKVKNSSDPEGEKKKLRIQGFTWGFVENRENNPELEQIEQILKGQSNEKNALAKHRADLVKGGTVKIKQYYLETNKIPEIRGASRLLDRINNEKTEELAKQLHIKECLIYAGGGKMMGIFPEGTGTEFCHKMEQAVEEETVTAQSNFFGQPYEICRLVSDYKKVVEEMDLALEARQSLRWDFRIEPEGRFKVTEAQLKQEGVQKLVNGNKELCTSCRNRYAAVEYQYGKPREKLCLSCIYKKLEGGRKVKHSKFQEYIGYVEKKHGKKISGDDTPCNKLKDIAGSENGFIGVIYGDANSMSKQINTLESFMMMRYFSQVTSGTVTDIVFESLFLNMKDNLSFEVIAVGGDDIFLIVPGKKAFDIACTIGRLFDQQFRNRSAGKNNITMSIGVCITHAKMPVQYSFRIARNLLKSAKQKAWKERQKGNVTGTIDWMVIENETAECSVLEYQRREIKGKPEKTLRPYTWHEAKAMKEFLYLIKEERTFSFQMQQSWYQHTKEESGLFYEYQIARQEKTGICRALDHLSGELGGRVDKSNVVLEGKTYSPWPDVAELWDYGGEGMGKVEIEIKLTIKFYDSFFFGGGTGEGEIQSYLMRDVDGLPYISGAALKGCIAEYAAALSQLVPEFGQYEEIFGTGGVRQGGMYFENGNLIDKEVYSALPEKSKELRTGVSISRYTKAKKEGQLYTMELSGCFGKMVFQSSIYGFLDLKTYQKNIAHLVAAIRLIFALGGKRSAGLGWLQSPIECQVMKGERGKKRGLSKQEEIDPEKINQWIKDWIGGI